MDQCIVLCKSRSQYTGSFLEIQLLLVEICDTEEGGS